MIDADIIGSVESAMSELASTLRGDPRIKEIISQFRVTDNRTAGESYVDIEFGNGAALSFCVELALRGRDTVVEASIRLIRNVKYSVSETLLQLPEVAL